MAWNDHILAFVPVDDIDCFWLRKVLPDPPLFRVPFFRRRMADSTVFDAARPYLAI